MLQDAESRGFGVTGAFDFENDLVVERRKTDSHADRQTDINRTPTQRWMA